MFALKAVIFDWAGTVVDFGSRAPLGAFVAAFERFGIEISTDEARQPMGLPKREHIAALLAAPRISAAWQAAHGAAPSEIDVDAVYDVFVPLNTDVVTRFAELVPGVAATVKALRQRGLKIGSTTGYTREIMEPLLPRAATQGFAPDTVVCAGDLAAGRPTALMMYKAFLDLAVWPASACVKVDDTVPGIAEGQAAGTWTVGVAVSGNAMGLSLPEWQALPTGEQAARRERATQVLRGAGAHRVIDSVADLLPCVDEFEAALANGERP